MFLSIGLTTEFLQRLTVTISGDRNRITTVISYFKLSNTVSVNLAFLISDYQRLPFPFQPRLQLKIPDNKKPPEEPHEGHF